MSDEDRVQAAGMLSRAIMVMVAAMFILVFAVQVFAVVEPWITPLHMIQGPARHVAPNIIVGPYPHEQDLVQLKRVGVAEVVSLLSPSVPGESQLLEKERLAVKAAGLKFKDYPMSFLSLNSVGNNRTAKALAARVLAEYGDTAKDKVYIHCYLGRHRTGLVEAAIAHSLVVKRSHSGARVSSDK